MIEAETVFILGAGASKPCGFPVARDLRIDIIRQYSNWLNKLQIHEIYKSEYQSLKNEALKLIRHFKKSNTQSIDLYLARNKEFSEIGRMAIVCAILQAEEKSLFGDDILLRGNKLPDWYSYLLRRMTDTLISDDNYRHVASNNVTFVTFNYDRSLEHFLFESLSNSFLQVPQKKIIQALNTIKIIHVYGTVCKLPWQDKNGLPYGFSLEKLTIEKLKELSQNIQIVHDNYFHDNDHIKDRLIEAKNIYILGFGYAKENINAIGLRTSIRKHHKIYGTAKEFVKKEIDDVSTYIKGKSSESVCIELEDMDSLELLRNYL